MHNDGEAKTNSRRPKEESRDEGERNCGLKLLFLNQFDIKDFLCVCVCVCVSDIAYTCIFKEMVAETVWND